MDPVLWDDAHSNYCEITRSIGDLSIKKETTGYSDEPEISHYQLTENDSALVIGSHAIWKHLSNDKIATIMAEFSG